MGGCGTLAIGMPHGGVFAAIRATVPAGTQYVASRMGGFPQALPADASRRGTRHLDKSTFTGFGLPDPPVIVDFSAQNDNWSKTQPALPRGGTGGTPSVGPWLGTFRSSDL